MTFSYAAPNASGVFGAAKDEVRFLARDTVATASSVQDEDIAYYLAQRNQDRRLAAADALDARATTVESSSRKTITVGPFSTSLASTESAASLRALAESLREGVLAGGSPVVTLPADDDGFHTVFSLGMNDGYGYGSPDRLWV